MHPLGEKGGVRNCDTLTKILYKIEHSGHAPNRCGEAWFCKGIFYMSINCSSRCPTDFVDGLQIFVNMDTVMAKKSSTLSTSASVRELIASAEEKARWLRLMSGKMRCLEMSSDDR